MDNLEAERAKFERAIAHATAKESAREILSRVESVDKAMELISTLHHTLEA